MIKQISIQVNGTKHKMNVDPETPLLYVLRNELKLNSPKYGCGLDQCGSCMVLLDDEAVTTCQLPVESVTGRSIVTLEGLASQDGILHPVQKSFIEQQATQCGYCLNGMIISAVALLKKNPAPDRQAINESLHTNLCRCGTYSRFINAIRTASEKI